MLKQHHSTNTLVKMQSKVYFSIPMEMHWDTACIIMRQLVSTDKVIDYWIRNSPYNENVLRNCDAFVIMLPKLAWSETIDKLPIGCRRELMLAIQLKKKIYITYKPHMADVASIYESHIAGGIIQGIPVTAGNIKREDFSSKNNTVAFKIETNKVSLEKTDSRLLLLL